MISNKLDLLKEVEILKSSYDIPQLGQLNTSLDSIKNNGNVRDFLFDLVYILVGSQSLNKIIGNSIKGVFKLAETQIKSSLFIDSQTTNYQRSLGSYSFFNNGIEVPLKTLDKKKQFNFSPNSFEGQTLYSKNIGSLDRKIYEAVNTNQIVNYKDTLNIQFNNSNQKLKILPFNQNESVNSFLQKYIKNIDVFDEETITKNLLNKLFGKQNKNSFSDIELNDDMTIDSYIEQINNNDDIESLILVDINPEATLSTNLVDLGCGYFELLITQENYDKSVSEITSQNSNDSIGNSFNNLLNNAIGEENNSNDSEIKSGFFKNIIKQLQNSLIQNLIKTPDLSIGLNLIAGFKNDSLPFFNDSKDLIKNNIPIIKNLSSSVECIITNVLNDIIEEQIKKITKSLINRLKKEKLDIYKKITSSII